MLIFLQPFFHLKFFCFNFFHRHIFFAFVSQIKIIFHPNFLATIFVAAHFFVNHLRLRIFHFNFNATLFSPWPLFLPVFWLKIFHLNFFTVLHLKFLIVFFFFNRFWLWIFYFDFSITVFFTSILSFFTLFPNQNFSNQLFRYNFFFFGSLFIFSSLFSHYFFFHWQTFFSTIIGCKGGYTQVT